MRTVLVLLKLAMILSGIWCFLWSFPLANRFILLANEAGYTEGTFTVERVEYLGDIDSGASWWLEGTVETAGARASDERFSPHGSVRDVRSQQ